MKYLFKHTRLILALTFVIASLLSSPGYSQSNNSTQSSQTLAERLGYSDTDKLLIVHNDDIGFSGSANAATLLAFDMGPLKSGAFMVPPPWFLIFPEDTSPSRV